jgi:hypothetical protein
LKQGKEESLEQHRVVKQERENLQVKFAQDREQIQNENEQLLTEQMGVKEAVTRELCFVPGLAHIEEDIVENQLENLAEDIQQLQERVVELELQAVPSTLQEVRD